MRNKKKSSSLRPKRSRAPEIEIPNVLINKIGNIQIGATKGFLAFGICWKDKYCWTNVFGFEKLN